MIIEGFDALTSAILFNTQIEVKPSFVQASQAFSEADGLTMGGLGGERPIIATLESGLEGDRETPLLGLFLDGEPWAVLLTAAVGLVGKVVVALLVDEEFVVVKELVVVVVGVVVVLVVVVVVVVVLVVVVIVVVVVVVVVTLAMVELALPARGLPLGSVADLSLDN